MLLISEQKISSWLTFLFYLLLFLACYVSPIRAQSGPDPRPNILIAIADDASYPHMGAYGAEWIDTPAFDRVAARGLLFMNAYTPNAKCAPSRANILTGRNSWQLEEAANHNPYFPRKFKVYTEVLAGQGYFVGSTGKGWAPGVASNKDGKPRHLAGQPFNEHKTRPPTSGISANDYAANFKAFLEAKSAGQPFAFWYGGYEPHRSYAWRSGIEKGGKSLRQIKDNDIPAFFPDNDTVRTDLLDYAFELEHFDKHLGRMLDMLEKRGELANTLVVVTADNGMPFPRVKGQEYEYSNHMPLAIMWPAGITNPGRKITDFVSFIDFAPTFLQVAGIRPGDTAMQPITGQSLVNIFESGKSGRVDAERNYVLIGKERHDVGRPHDWGYPIRGIVTDTYLYLHNFKPDRWPAGPPITGYLNTDGSPTKTWILDHQEVPGDREYWQWSFGKRPAEELYKLNRDPANVRNLAADSAYGAIRKKLKARLFRALEAQGDPRMAGEGAVFDQYPYANKKMRNFYRKYMNGILDKSDAGWVNPTDFREK